MQNIRVRQLGSNPIAMRSIQRSGNGNSHSLLTELGRHLNTKSFGGALLAPHASPQDVQNILKPALNGFKQNQNIKQHTSNLMRFQESIMNKNPKLRTLIEGSRADQMNKIQDPFENMDNRQLYHHVMQLGNKDWNNTKEIAGQIAGKHPSKFASHEEMPQVLNHVRKRYNLGGSVSTGGSVTSGGSVSTGGGFVSTMNRIGNNPLVGLGIGAAAIGAFGYDQYKKSQKGGSVHTGGTIRKPPGKPNRDPNDKYSPSDLLRPHFADLSITPSPHLAAARLEHEPNDSNYSHALRASLYGSQVAPLDIQHS